MIKTYKPYYPLYHDKEKFIILITGGRGCERPEQEIMMADLSVKQIKDIQVGDKVMGDDGAPRTVLSMHRGRSKMYEVWQSNGETYYVNDRHILSLCKSHSAKTTGRYPSWPDVLDIPIEDYLKHQKRWQYNFRGYKVGSIPYPHKEVLIEPYLLGLWLGDGTALYPQITTPDKEIVDYLYDYADRHGLHISVAEKANGRNIAKGYRLSSNGGIGANKILNQLREYDLINNKHIPQCYISNSEDVRLQLLAGLIDTDGSYDGWAYDFVQKNEQIAKSVALIASSLGFRAKMQTRRARIGQKEYGTVYRVCISGDLYRIPCRVASKKAKEGDSYKNRTFSQSSLRIKQVKDGDWVGLVLDGNHRYVHADGTVTHNSGKSFSASTFIERLTFEYNAAKKIAHQILFTRYTMASASISVIPEFLEKVDLDGTAQYFHKAANDVVNTMTKSRVMFRGIHTSSGNQTAKLKSIQGVTTFVVDEGEEWVNEEEFERIMLSIRTKGLQNRVIIIMNPADSNHWVYKRFIKDTHKIVEYDGVPVQISTHPNVLHIHTSYLDNIENLSEQFLKEVLDMKVKNPERYAHIVMGQWADVAEGAVFKKWGVVDEFPKYAKKVARAMDLGYTCFKGDTLITTLRGDIPIKDVTIDDYVLTRKGFRRVRNNLYNGRKKVITKELLVNGTKYQLSATYEHNINVNGKWKKYGELTEKDRLFVLSPTKVLSSEDIQTANIPTTITTSGKAKESTTKSFCTMSSTRIITEKSQTERLYTILTRIRSITTRLTSWLSHCLSTVNFTTKNLVYTRQQNTQEKFASQRITGKSEETKSKPTLQQKSECVNIAEKSLRQQTCINDSAQRNVIIDGSMLQKRTMYQQSANGAEKPLWATSTSDQKVVAKNVLISSRGIDAVTNLAEEVCDVYDLEIDGVHEYFANGILVHNCDPTAIVRCGIVDNRLYVDELCYKTGMTSGDIIRELRQEEQNGDDGFVYSESADPRLIDEIALGGVIIYPVVKGQGSILEGLSKMLDMELFVTKRSVHLQEELRNYVYAKDKFGEYTNYPEDHDNHGIDSCRYYVLSVILGKVMHPKRVTKKDLGVY